MVVACACARGREWVKWVGYRGIEKYKKTIREPAKKSRSASVAVADESDNNTERGCWCGAKSTPHRSNRGRPRSIHQQIQARSPGEGPDSIDVHTSQSCPPDRSVRDPHLFGPGLMHGWRRRAIQHTHPAPGACAAALLLLPLWLAVAPFFVECPTYPKPPRACHTGTARPSPCPTCTAGHARPSPKRRPGRGSRRRGARSVCLLRSRQAGRQAGHPGKGPCQPRPRSSMGLTQSSTAHKGSGKRAAIVKELDRCVFV